MKNTFPLEPVSGKHSVACWSCEFWRRNKHARETQTGVCYRYPKPLDKREHEWCGDHSKSNKLR